MARRRRNRQASKRQKPILMLGKKLRIEHPVALGGGLYARLLGWNGTHLPPRRDSKLLTLYRVDLSLRTRGARDIALVVSDWRGTAEEAVEHAEQVLTHFASALRQAGAT